MTSGLQTESNVRWKDSGKWRVDLSTGILERRLRLGKRAGRMPGVKRCDMEE